MVADRLPGARSDWRRWIAVIATVTGLAMLAAGLLADLHRYLDVFSHLMWHAAGATIGGLGALAMPRRAIPMLAMAAALTIAIPAAVSYSRQRAEGPPADKGTLKVLSFNTWHSNRSHERIAALIEAELPDVAVLLEFGPDKQPLLDRLARLYPYQTGCVHRWYCGVALIARRPFLEAGYEPRNRDQGPPRAWASFESGIAGKPWTIIGAHVMRPIDSPRRHLSELERLAAQVRRAAGPVIVVGDMNSVRWASSLSGFVERAGLRHMDRFLPSWPAGRRGPPQLAIDHVFASDELEIVDAWLGPEAGSDHMPLLAVVGSRTVPLAP